MVNNAYQSNYTGEEIDALLDKAKDSIILTEISWDEVDNLMTEGVYKVVKMETDEPLIVLGVFNPYYIVVSNYYSDEGSEEKTICQVRFSDGQIHRRFHNSALYEEEGWTEWEDIAQSTIPIEQGGTGATTAADARTNLGVASQADMDKIANNTTLIKGTNGGFAGGYDASVKNGGGAIGDGTTTTSGCSVGMMASSVHGGAVGYQTSTNNGGSVGANAESDSGGAVGELAKTGAGFAGGYNAQTIDADDMSIGIDAIQLGTGTNNSEKTLQVYDYQLMDADGNIPEERLGNLGDTIIDLGDIDVSAEDGSGRVADLDLNTLFTDIHTDGIYKFGLSADDFYVSSYLIVGKVFGEVSGGVYFNETTTWQLLFNPNNTLDVLYRLYNSDNDTHMYQWTQFKRLFPTIAEHDALETRVSQKLDKDTIVTEAANNTLLLQENQDARLGETSSLVLSMPESIGDWYRSTFSFQSGESATSLVYGYTPLDWKGDDVTSDGRFVPEPFSTYEVDVKNLGVNGVRARVDKIAGYTSVDVEGTALSLPSSAGKALRDYKIYGNSVQDGEPSEETPVVIQSVGDYNEKTRKYDVPIVLHYKNWWHCPDSAVLHPSVTYEKDSQTFTTKGAGIQQFFYQFPVPIPAGTTCAVTLKMLAGEMAKGVLTVGGFHRGDPDYIQCAVSTKEGSSSVINESLAGRTFTSVSTADHTITHLMIYIDGGYLVSEPLQFQVQFEISDIPTDYEPYIEPVTTTISLDEPLRKVGDVADYIDYAGQKVVRQVEVNDDTGTLPLEESYFALDAPVDEPMELPTIGTDLYDNVITVDTEIQPSNVKVTYFKKG